MELCSTLLFWTWFVINFFPLQSLWDVWIVLCCNLWAHLRVSVVCWSWNSVAFYRGFTRGTTGECQFGSELLSNKDQCTRAQFFWVVPPQQHTQLNSPFSLGAWGLHPRCLGSLGGVEEEESEEESGEVPGLSALFSACTSTDAYSVVSVRGLLVYLELEFRSQVIISALYKLMCMLRE